MAKYSTNFGYTSKLTVEITPAGTVDDVVVYLDSEVVIRGYWMDEIMCDGPTAFISERLEDSDGNATEYGIKLFKAAERLIRRRVSDYYHSNS